MHDSPRSQGVLRVLLAGLVLAATPALAQFGHTWIFSNGTYADPFGSTAVWDYAAGVLRAPAYQSTELGNLTLAAESQGVTVVGDIAYVAARSAGVHAVDVSNPAAPVLLDTYDTPGSAYAIDVRGDFLFVADWALGLRILDASDPTNLQPASYVLTLRQVLDVVVDGAVAYIADDSDGVKAYDVSDPYAPILIGALDTAGAEGLDLEGNVLYVADDKGGILAIDVQDPSAMVLLGQINTSGRTKAVAVAGNRAYLAETNSGLVVVDVEDPTNLQVVTTAAVSGDCVGVEVRGDIVYLANTDGGLQIYDVSDPTAPQLQETLDTVGEVYDIALYGDEIFVADWDQGLRAFRIAQRLSVEEVERVEMTESARDVAIEGNIAYVVGYEGIVAYDITDPRAPVALNAGSTTNFRAAEVSGNLLFAADSFKNLHILDVSDPATPWTLSLLDLGGLAINMMLDGDVLFVSTYLSNQLMAVDVSDPASPSILDTEFVSNTLDMASHGRWLFTAQYTSGLAIYDVADPTTIIAVNTIATAYSALSVEIHGEHLLVGGDGGLEVYDISSPTTPTLVGAVAAPGSGRLDYLTMLGDDGYASGNNSIYAVDVADPANPSIYASSWTSGSAVATMIGTDGTFLFVTTTGNSAGENGMTVLVTRQRDVEDAYTNYTAYSTALPDVDDVVRARLSTEASGGIWSYQLTSAPGAFGTGIGVGPSGDWYEISEWSTLGWAVTLRWWPSGPPILDELSLDWMNAAGPIDALVDAPNDQGGWARMTIERSGYDFTDDDRAPVTGYQVYREVNDPSSAPASDDVYVPEGTGLGRRVTSDGTLARAALANFPGGTWEAVAWVAARQQDTYTIAVPTVADGPGHTSNFVVTTHTTDPTRWFASPTRSVVSTDDIAPGVPANLLAAYEASVVNLSWAPSDAEDFQFHRVYRSSTPDFEVDASLLLSETAGTIYEDATPSPWEHFYKVTAVDHTGNESAPAEVQTATGAPVSAGRALVLEEPRPNPFNPATSLHFTLPRTGAVRLVVHDLSGRRVQTLVDGRMESGTHEVRWNGRDDTGRRVASGVYLARLSSGEETQVRRLTLVK